jgi:hypothetical protein
MIKVPQNRPRPYSSTLYRYVRGNVQQVAFDSIQTTKLLEHPKREDNYSTSYFGLKEKQMNGYFMRTEINNKNFRLISRLRINFRKQ